MSLPSFSTAIPTNLREVGTISTPAWITGLLQFGSPACCRRVGGLFVDVSKSKQFNRVAVRIAGAADLSADALREQTRRAYGQIFQVLNEKPAAHPVRFWNFIPGIHDPMGGEQSRYMVFNAGRFLAFQDRYGDCNAFDRNIAAASGVGHGGEDLWIHCLASVEAGVHLGNPRQVSPHRYSSRFGRLPPCFARATLLPTRSLLLIAGTASICGEESLHHDLAGQLDETLANLEAVVQTGRTRRYDSQKFQPDALNDLTEVRIYHSRLVDLHPLKSQLIRRLGERPRLEFIHADLCRPELLVEIEAIADLSDRPSEGALQ